MAAAFHEYWEEVEIPGRIVFEPRSSRFEDSLVDALQVELKKRGAVEALEEDPYLCRSKWCTGDGSVLSFEQSLPPVIEYSSPEVHARAPLKLIDDYDRARGLLLTAVRNVEDPPEDLLFLSGASLPRIGPSKPFHLSTHYNYAVKLCPQMKLQLGTCLSALIPFMGGFGLARGRGLVISPLGVSLGRICPSGYRERRDVTPDMLQERPHFSIADRSWQQRLHVGNAVDPSFTRLGLLKNWATVSLLIAMLAKQGRIMPSIREQGALVLCRALSSLGSDPVSRSDWDALAWGRGYLIALRNRLFGALMEYRLPELYEKLVMEYVVSIDELLALDYDSLAERHSGWLHWKMARSLLAHLGITLNHFNEIAYRATELACNCLGALPHELADLGAGEIGRAVARPSVEERARRRLLSFMYLKRLGYEDLRAYASITSAIRTMSARLYDLLDSPIKGLEEKMLLDWVGGLDPSGRPQSAGAGTRAEARGAAIRHACENGLEACTRADYSNVVSFLPGGTILCYSFPDPYSRETVFKRLDAGTVREECDEDECGDGGYGAVLAHYAGRVQGKTHDDIDAESSALLKEG